MQLFDIIESLKGSRSNRNTIGRANELHVNSSLPSRAKVSWTRRLVRALVPRTIRRTLAGWVSDWQVMNSPDRVYLRQVILPQIARRGGVALLIGCRRYTQQDPIFLQQHGTVCWTMDIDPAVARWGAKGRHVVAPIERAASHFCTAMFDTVVLSGVFGFGVNEICAQVAAIDACAAILKPGGLLVLGWNSDLVIDPTMLTGLARHFDRASDTKPVGRVTFHRGTHVFDFHTRRPKFSEATRVSE
jgi:hypothetical protein